MKVFEELIKRKKQGHEACVFLIVPRNDCLNARFVWDISSLASGAVYTDISRETGMSTATISRVSKCLEKGAGGYRTVLKRQAKHTDYNAKN